MSKKILTLENFILVLINKRKNDLMILNDKKNEYSEKDYWILFHQYHASINDLTMSLTSYSNPLAQIKM